MTIIKTTTSVCPSCLEKVPATVSVEEGRVLLTKTCSEHGDSRALLARDVNFYYPSNSDGCSTGGCCMLNHSCSLIFELTDKCNLSCPTCFAASSPDKSWFLPVEDFEAQLDRLLEAGKTESDVVQLSGGEPTVHPEIERIIALCFDKGIDKVYLSTNGIRMGKEPDFVARLGKWADRLNIYLQMDGLTDAPYEQLRGAKGLLPIKQRAIKALLDTGIYVMPVMTVTPGVNDQEVGEVVRFGLDHHPQMDTVMLQPAMYAGRYTNDQPFERFTVGDMVRLVEEQTDGLFTSADFGPIPCSDPNCFSMAVGLVPEPGRLIPVSRYFPPYETWTNADVAERIERFRDQLPHKMVESIADDELVDQLLDLLTDGDSEKVVLNKTGSFFAVAIKPFMDAHTYDQDRVDKCCVHVVDRQGEPVSLCEYNTIRRPQGLL